MGRSSRSTGIYVRGATAGRRPVLWGVFLVFSRVVQLGARYRARYGVAKAQDAIAVHASARVASKGDQESFQIDAHVFHRYR